ncbi:hypothetical protein [Aquipuribacter sp. SD81]|uniref:hypothetical protein n=1 Tax=Aquipuribacter sp. SD81 TaxID=3127703 RepID=UPI00301926BC
MTTPTTRRDTDRAAAAPVPAPAAPVDADPGEPARSAPPRAMRLAGASALVAGPLLFVAGMVTSPDMAGEGAADYVTSLARDEVLTQVSALFLHYGNLLMGLGFLAAPLLVRGRRGRGLTVLGALVSAVAFLNQAGALLSDWWIMELGRTLDLAQAAALSESALAHPLLQVWFGTEVLCAVGPVLLLAGLARAGVLHWVTVPWLVLGVVGGFALGGTQPLLLAGLLLVALAPFALIGVRLFQRVRAGVA